MFFGGRLFSGGGALWLLVLFSAGVLLFSLSCEAAIFFRWFSGGGAAASLPVSERGAVFSVPRAAVSFAPGPGGGLFPLPFIPRRSERPRFPSVGFQGGRRCRFPDAGRCCRFPDAGRCCRFPDTGALSARPGTFARLKTLCPAGNSSPPRLNRAETMNFENNWLNL